MKRSIIIISITMIACLAKAQNKVIERRDIRELQAKLSKVKGSERVDVLNKIAFYWVRLFDTTLNWAGIAKLKHDSVTAYAKAAYNESLTLKYDRGKGIAKVYLAHGKYFEWWDEKGYPVEVQRPVLDTMELLLDQAMPFIEEAGVHVELAEYYVLKGDISRKKNLSNLEPYVFYWKKAINQYELAGDVKQASEFSTWLSFSLIDAGHLNDALDCSLKGLQLARQWMPTDTSYSTKDWKEYLIKQSLDNLATIAKNGGDHYSSLNYLSELDEYQKTCLSPWPIYYQKSDLYIDMGKIDSAKIYLSQYRTSGKPNSPNNAVYANYLAARIGLVERRYNEVAPVFTALLDSFVAIRRPYEITGSAYHAGEAYFASGDNTEALRFARIAVEKANQWGKRASLVPVYELLSRIHHSLGASDSAYLYLSRYVKLKDSIRNTQLLWQLHKVRKDASVAMLMKENHYKETEIRRQATLKNVLLVALLLLLISGAVIWRNIKLRKNYVQLELNRRQAELKQQAQDLEMKALKAQMNPHFIFNSLSSINWFILKNRTQEASDYLTSFSRLIRMVLANSEKPVVTLEEELKMLRLYLDIEQLRLQHSFDYRIEMMNNIDPAEIIMPPLVLQPFCENAIWHGLSHKPGKGLLSVNFELNGNTLNCTITDNGVGREMATKLNNGAAHKEKSMGIQITNTRLSLFNGSESESQYYKIEDIMDQHGEPVGTKVTLTIKSKIVA